MFNRGSWPKHAAQPKLDFVTPDEKPAGGLERKEAAIEAASRRVRSWEAPPNRNGSMLEVDNPFGDRNISNLRTNGN